jgi:hypothetical protein
MTVWPASVSARNPRWSHSALGGPCLQIESLTKTSVVGNDRATDQPTSLASGVAGTSELRTLGGQQRRERLVQGLAPVADRLDPDGGPAVVAENAVGGPRSRADEGGAGGRADPFGVRAEQSEDLPDEAEPGGFAAAGAVVDPGRRDSGQRGAPEAA